MLSGVSHAVEAAGGPVSVLGLGLMGQALAAAAGAAAVHCRGERPSAMRDQQLTASRAGVTEQLVSAIAAGVTLPILPVQILWINMITHGVPGVAFGGEPLDLNARLDTAGVPVVALVGSCMNCGKTAAACTLR